MCIYLYAKQKHQRCKKVGPNQKHQLAILIMHTTKKDDIWWRPRPKLSYILEGSVSHQLQSKNTICNTLTPQIKGN